jgi:hypothetical protein
LSSSSQDEVIVSLLLNELPTAKKFKDAVKSLSPEQQRFARAFRKMQLSSSIFGVCIVQIKLQLEALLGLRKDALDKAMKLTQDLMELFVEYQVPSDVLSYSGFLENVATQDKVSYVTNNVNSVLDVINTEKDIMSVLDVIYTEKEKQLKSEQAKTEMAIERMAQAKMREGLPLGNDGYGSAPVFGSGSAPVFGTRYDVGSASAPKPRLFGIGSSAQPPIMNYSRESRLLGSAPEPRLESSAQPPTFASDEMQSLRPNEEMQA